MMNLFVLFREEAPIEQTVVIFLGDGMTPLKPTDPDEDFIAYEQN